MARKIFILSLVSTFLFFNPLYSQIPTSKAGGKILFQPLDQALLSVSAISGALNRCETYMDYLATGGWCRSFATKIGSIMDFSIGYTILLMPQDYEEGDSFRWTFTGPSKGLSLIGGYDCYKNEYGYYCWASTANSRMCDTQEGKRAVLMNWSIYPQNFHRPNTIIGKWTVVVTKNGAIIAQDSFTILPAEISDRQEALDELDTRWNLMSADERSSTVFNRTSLNDFLGSVAHVTDKTLAQDIALAKQAYPQYSSFDEDLAKAIIKGESGGNYLIIGRDNEIGLGQERIFCDVSKNEPGINAYEEFLQLRESDLSNQDFEDFKTITFSDDRSLIIQSIAILFMHITDELMSKDFIGDDIRKILAGYNWGGNNLHRWLNFCTQENIDWYDNLNNPMYSDQCYEDLPRQSSRRNAYNYINNVLKYY